MSRFAFLIWLNFCAFYLPDLNGALHNAFQRHLYSRHNADVDSSGVDLNERVVEQLNQIGLKNVVVGNDGRHDARLHRSDSDSKKVSFTVASGNGKHLNIFYRIQLKMSLFFVPCKNFGRTNSVSCFFEKIRLVTRNSLPYLMVFSMFMFPNCQRCISYFFSK
jgi:hypothetical protein